MEDVKKLNPEIKDVNKIFIDQEINVYDKEE